MLDLQQDSPELAPTREDYPPELMWEQPVWTLYQRYIDQRITGMSWTPINYVVLVPAIERAGWHIELTLQLFESLFTAERVEIKTGDEEDDDSYIA